MAYKFLAESKDTSSVAPTKEYLFIVEGEDDGVFLEHILSLKGADPLKVEIQYIKGIAKIPEYLLALAKSPPLTSGDIKNIALVIDADLDFDKALEAVSKWLNAAGFPAVNSGSVNKDGPVSVGVYLLPDSGSTGELEDLIISSLGDDSRVIEARSLIGKFENDKVKFKKSSKRVIQISLAVSNVPLCSGAGRGIRNGAFEIGVESIQSLSNFIDDFIS